MKQQTDNPDTRPPSGHGFEKLFKEDGKYYFQYRDSQGEALLFSRSYQSDRSRDNGIQAVIRAVGIEEQYERKQNKKGRHYFILKSGNHQELSRSRMFDSEEEMVRGLQEIKSIEEKAPVFDRADRPGDEAEKTEETATTPAKTGVEAAGKSESAKTAANPSPMPPFTETPEKSDRGGKMPRYKFSVIYYPDSDIWMVKNDFSGDSKQLKTCDGVQIAAFLQSQLPTDAIPDRAEGFKKAAPKRPDAISQRMLPKEMPLKIETYKGEVVKKTALPSSLKSIEVTPVLEQGAQDQLFEGEIIARSLENNQTTVIAKIPVQWSKQGRLHISIQRANYLNPGLYLFIADLHQSQSGEKTQAFYGSQLVELN